MLVPKRDCATADASASAAAGGARTVARRSLLDLDPELGRLLSPERYAAAQAEVTVHVHPRGVGPWPVKAMPVLATHHLGLLILDGVIASDVMLEDVVSTELLGAGDILRPWPVEDPARMVGDEVGWMVLAECRLAALDQRAAVALGHYPELYAVLVERLDRRARRLARTQAIAELNRVERRVLAMLWHLAERWGRVTSDGVLIPLNISHRLLAQLIGARRPTVSTAVGALTGEGCVERRPDGAWIVRGEPVGVSPHAERLLSRRRLITDQDQSDIEESRVDELELRLRRRPRLRRRGSARLLLPTHPAQLQPSDYDTMIRVLGLVWDCPEDGSVNVSGYLCAGCSQAAACSSIWTCDVGFAEADGGGPRPVRARPRAAGTGKARAIGTAAAASELDREGFALWRSQIAKVCSSPGSARRNRFVSAHRTRRGMKNEGLDRRPSMLGLRTSVDGRPRAPWSPVRIRGRRGGSHSKSKSSAVPVSSKMRCTAGGQGIRAEAQLGAARRLGIAEQQVKPGRVDERQAPEIDHHTPEAGVEKRAQCLLQTRRAHEVELAGEHDAHARALVDDMAPEARRQCRAELTARGGTDSWVGHNTTSKAETIGMPTLPVALRTPWTSTGYFRAANARTRARSTVLRV